MKYFKGLIWKIRKLLLLVLLRDLVDRKDFEKLFASGKISRVRVIIIRGPNKKKKTNNIHQAPGEIPPAERTPIEQAVDRLNRVYASENKSILVEADKRTYGVHSHEDAISQETQAKIETGG